MLSNGVECRLLGNTECNAVVLENHMLYVTSSREPTCIESCRPLLHNKQLTVNYRKISQLYLVKVTCMKSLPSIWNGVLYVCTLSSSFLIEKMLPCTNMPESRNGKNYITGLNCVFCNTRGKSSRDLLLCMQTYLSVTKIPNLTIRAPGKNLGPMITSFYYHQISE